jgi:purine-binding chemotaxis protein CheW
VFAGRPTDNQNDAPAALDVLLVQLAGELFAIPSGNVREVIRYRPYTPVPGAPPTLPGILNQRGSILPMVDPHPLLGIESAPITRSSRLVIVSHADVDMALLVE